MKSSGIWFWKHRMPLDKTNSTTLGIQEQLVLCATTVFCFQTFVHIFEKEPNTGSGGVIVISEILWRKWGKKEMLAQMNIQKHNFVAGHSNSHWPWHHHKSHILDTWTILEQFLQCLLGTNMLFFHMKCTGLFLLSFSSSLSSAKIIQLINPAPATWSSFVKIWETKGRTGFYHLSIGKNMKQSHNNEFILISTPVWLRMDIMRHCAVRKKEPNPLLCPPPRPADEATLKRHIL